MGTVKDGFDGLWSKYRVHEIDIIVKDPNSPLLSRLGLPDGLDFKTISGAGLHSAFGQRQHAWSWIPVTNAGYVARAGNVICGQSGALGFAGKSDGVPSALTPTAVRREDLRPPVPSSGTMMVEGVEVKNENT